MAEPVIEQLVTTDTLASFQKMHDDQVLVTYYLDTSSPVAFYHELRFTRAASRDLGFMKRIQAIGVEAVKQLHRDHHQGNE